MSVVALFKALVGTNPICPSCERGLFCRRCGSTNVTAHGFPGHNHRHVCHDCGMSEWWMV